MKKPTVYIEITVDGHIAAWDQRKCLYMFDKSNRVDGGRFKIASILWYLSVVVDECTAGDATAASERLALVSGIPILTASDDVQYDSINEEILRIKHELASKFDNDLARIVADTRSRERNTISMTPRPLKSEQSVAPEPPNDPVSNVVRLLRRMGERGRLSL